MMLKKDNILFLTICSLLLFVTTGTVSAALRGNEITSLTIDEPGVANRTSAPVTSGVPVPAGTDINSLSLFDGDQEIPVQISKLKGSSATWVLLDFQVSMPQSTRRTLSLRDAAPLANPASPLSIVDNGSEYIVDTGPLKLVIPYSSFNLFKEVWNDSDGNGAWDTKVISSSGSNLNLSGRDSGTSNASLTGNGAPSNMTWEYGGPGSSQTMRATLRIDGQYGSLLNHTTRITFYAGLGAVRVEHLLRNSKADNETTVKVRSASLKIGDGNGVTVTAVRPGSMSWAKVTAQSGATFELVPSSFYYASSSSNGGMVVADQSYHGASIMLDFAPSSTTSAVEQKSPLFALADGSWYSKYGSVSVQKFGDLADEVATYAAWGWSGGPAKPSEPHNPDYFISWKNIDVHGDLEADDLWQNMIMYMRTGQRGYWDRARGWARYYKWEYPHRTDNFEYAWSGNFETGTSKSRPTVQPSNLSGDDSNYVNNSVGPGKIDIFYSDYGGDHMYGWGLLDYYHMTGDLAAIDAAVDIAEVSKRVLEQRTPGSYSMGEWGMRLGGRHFLLVTRLFEVTGDSSWQTYMNHLAALWKQSPDWYEQDNAGFYYYGSFDTDTIISNGSYNAGAKVFSTFQLNIISHAFQRYYDATGRNDTTIKNRIIALANFVLKYGLHSTADYSGKAIAVNWPNSGDIWHKYFDGGGGFDPFYTISLVDVLMRGYLLTNNQQMLNNAKQHWNRGSKAEYGSTARLAGDNEIRRYVNGSFLDDHLYVSNGDLSYTALLFAGDGLQTDNVAPSAPSSVSVD